MDDNLYTFTLAGIKKIVDEMLEEGALADAPCYFLLADGPYNGSLEDIDIYNIGCVDELVAMTEDKLSTCYVFRGEGTVTL